MPRDVEIGVGDLDEEEIEAATDFMRMSQELVREEHGDEITVYRGMDEETFEEYGEETEEGVKFNPQAMESWTLEEDVAWDYGHTVVENTVSPEDIGFASELFLEDYHHNSHKELTSIRDSYTVADDEIVSKAEGEAETMSTEACNWIWSQLDDGVEEKSWVPYRGPRGGKGWRNTESGDVTYDDEPPGESVDEGQLEDAILETLGDSGDVLLDSAGGDPAQVLSYLVDNNPDAAEEVMDSLGDGEVDSFVGAAEEVLGEDTAQTLFDAAGGDEDVLRDHLKEHNPEALEEIRDELSDSTDLESRLEEETSVDNISLVGLDDDVRDTVEDVFMDAEEQGWLDNIDEVYTDTGDDEVASFSHVQNDFYINPDKFKDDDWSQLSDPSVEGILHHEIGHARHSENDRTEILSHQNLEGEEERIASKVSNQATRNGLEFVAEVHAALAGGQELDDDVLELYRDKMGPEV